MKNLKCALDATAVAVLLNVVLSKVLSHFATEDEVKPPNGAASLSLKGQFMHMMVHHKQVLFMSSFIVGLVVFLAVLLAYYLKPVGRFL
tara:strand:+ start:88 stop:354 length:267 start_codon:yes stop_codon:yes gene_type:complete